MGSGWLNIAFGEYHLQAEGFKIRFRKNYFWAEKGMKPTKWFRIYQIGTLHWN
jgi:hypothetical protein